MKRILTEDLHTHIGKEVTIAGWVNVRRDHGKLIFIDLRDRTGIVQMVALPNHAEAHKRADKVRPEWVLEVTGVVNKRPEKMVNPELKTGTVEIEIRSLTILSAAEELPFEKDADLNPDTFLDYRPLTLRREREQAIFRVQNTLVEAYREALRKKEFIEFQAPELVGEDAEGGANVFKLDYFYDKVAYLATSPQFYKQIMVGVYERVFSVSSVFRAEKHSTPRHLNEYRSLDAEFGFIEDHLTVMEILVQVVRHIEKKLKKTCTQEFKLLGASFPKIPKRIPQLKLREAQELITKETGEDSTKEPDLDPKHERWLCEYAKKKFKSDFIFITHYPVEKRPFYTFEDSKDPGFTKSFDLLFRGIEIATGGQRIHDYQTLLRKIIEKGLDPKSFSFYLEAFKYGMPPHGGWGMGLERLTAKFLELENVREATLFPRDINRIDKLLSE